MDVITILSESPTDLANASRTFLPYTAQYSCISFWGGLGAGKTTFIRALCQQLGVTDTVTSPTFSLINEYHSKGGDIVYHFDFYRLTTLQEATDIGVEDYFCSPNLCLIEWPALVTPLLPDDTLDVAIEVNSDGRRMLKLGERIA